MTVQIKHVYSSLMASLSKKRVYFEIFKFEIKGNLIFYISRTKRFKLSTRKTRLFSLYGKHARKGKRISTTQLNICAPFRHFICINFLQCCKICYLGQILIKFGANLASKLQQQQKDAEAAPPNGAIWYEFSEQH